MKSKIVVIAATAVICIAAIIFGGIIINRQPSETENDNASETVQTSTSESVSEASTESTRNDSHIVYETVATTVTNTEPVSDGRIYVDEDDEDGLFSGGYFEWQ